MNKKNTNKKTEGAMAMISLRLPKETITELKRVAPLLGFSGYQPLIRVYITQALQKDAAKILGENEADEFVYQIKERGVDDKSLKMVAETVMEYNVDAAPSFVVGMPEFIEATHTKGWGAETAELLNSLGEFGFDDGTISDPVEWVSEQRHQQAVNRTRLP